MTASLTEQLSRQLVLPVISAPMFIVSTPALVIAQCASGVVGSMPALNARPQEKFRVWLQEIHDSLAALRRQDPARVIAPYAINMIVHRTNERLQADMDVCAEFRTPLIITSLSAPNDIVKSVHGWGGKVFHDVISVRHAQKALEAGVDGLILVCAGAGGHAGALSPFALLGEVRRFYDGPIILSGSITRGDDILAARAMGADFAYVGTRFIASEEANAVPAYKQMLCDSTASDILYTPFFTGVHGNYLKPSIIAAGLDPNNLPLAEQPQGLALRATTSSSDTAKAWKDIWGAGQGVGNIDRVVPVQQIVATLRQEYHSARSRLALEHV